LAPALQPVCKPTGAGEGDERAEHDEAEGADEMAQNGTERMAEEIAGGNEAHRMPPSTTLLVKSQVDPNPTFTTSPAGDRVGQKAGIRTGLTPLRQSLPHEIASLCSQ
jgi:hypothetical protein